jgi:hypothetical protein
VHYERSALRGHGHLPSVLRRRRPPPCLRRRRDRRRLRLSRLRGSSRYHRKHTLLSPVSSLFNIIYHLKDILTSNFKSATEASDRDQERGVHALLALLLPHLKRRRLVLLRPPHEGLLRGGTHLEPK